MLVVNCRIGLGVLVSRLVLIFECCCMIFCFELVREVGLSSMLFGMFSLLMLCMGVIR